MERLHLYSVCYRQLFSKHFNFPANSHVPEIFKEGDNITEKEYYRIIVCWPMHHRVLSAWEGIMQEVSDYMIAVCNADVWVWLKALLAVHTMNFPLSILNDHSLFSSSEYYFVSCHGPQVFFLLLEFSDRKCTNSWGVTGRKDEGVRKERGQREEGSGLGRTVRSEAEHGGSSRVRTFMNCYPGHLELWGTERMEKSIFFSSIVHT